MKLPKNIIKFIKSTSMSLGPHLDKHEVIRATPRLFVCFFEFFLRSFKEFSKT